jgi:hypothetical protein
MELMRRGNEHFVLIDELEVAAGKFIAKLCKSPAGGPERVRALQAPYFELMRSGEKAVFSNQNSKAK